MEGGATAPGVGLDGEVPRDGLVERLRARWTVPVVLIEAPGGFGKSTLLVQALHDNRSRPVGVDHLVRCLEADRDPVRLLRTLLAELGGDPEPAADADRLLDALLDRIRLLSPTAVAVVLDDIHLVAGSEPLEAVLDRLVHSLPANGHLVVCGRHLPRLPLARLVAADGVVRLDRDDLAFTADEVARLADHYQVELDPVVASTRWPAVARLAATVGPTGSIDFMMEEVVAGLDAEVRRALCVATLSDLVDQDLLDELDVRCTPKQLATEVPLVAANHDGTVRVHDLWREAVDRLFDADERRDLTEGIVRSHLRARQPDKAIVPAAEAGLWPLARMAVVDAILQGDALLTVAGVADWLTRFPADQHDEPELLLLRSMLGRLEHGFTKEPELAHRAWQMFKEQGDLRAEASAGMEVGTAAWATNDVGTMFELYIRAQELAAEGEDGLGALVSMADGALADIDGRFDDAITHLASIDVDEVSRPIASLALRFLSTMLFLRGRSAEGVEVARRCAELLPNDYTRFVYDAACFQHGDVSAVRDHWVPGGCPQIGNARDQFLVGVKAAMINGSFGAAPDLSFIDLGTDRTRETTFVALVTAIARVIDGDEAGAAAVLEAHLAETGVDDPLVGGELGRFVPYAYVLSPTARAHLDGVDLGPKLAARRDLARIVLAARDSAEGFTPSLLPELEEIFCALPLPWSIELASRLAAVDADRAIALAQLLVDLSGERARERLRELSTGSGELAIGATQLLGHVAPEPDSVLHITACGPLTVARGADAPTSLSRARVRQLLGLLLLRPRLTRGQALALLWPESSEAAARNNLRVTLGHLRQELEPDRRRGEASFHLTGDGDELALRRSDSLAVDVWQIDAELRAGEAMEARRRPAEAVHHFARAADLWSGDVFADLRELVDVGGEIAEFDRRLVSAVADAGEWLLATGEHRTAADMAEKLIRHDPYNERGHRLAIGSAAMGAAPDHLALTIERCLAALAELGAEPDAETAMLLNRVG